MTVREHLSKAHQTIAASHRDLAACHKSAMGKAVAGDSMHEFHKAAAESHEHWADQHDAMRQECEKAIQSDLNKLVPTRISAVVPTAPVTPVLRHGQRSIPLADMVPDEFRKLVIVDEEQENER